MSEIHPAIICASLTGIIILFQLSLALGAPWGSASMGGKFPGKYPPQMRVVAVVNACILLFFASIVLSRAQIFFPQLYAMSRIAIWFVVAFFGVSIILHIITPSKIERIWAPVLIVQCITSIMVALQ